MLVRLIIFLIINFAALGIGGLFTGPGVDSAWYQSLNKAPWTPPGWVFGAAWTLIMILLAIFMTLAYDRVVNKKVLLGLFSLQIVLNILWNPIFFYWQDPALGIVVISLLTILLGFMVIKYSRVEGRVFIYLIPYLIWLILATSLNLYILVSN